METARVTARQVAESMSVQELRDSAKELRSRRDPDLLPEDIAQLLEYIADLRDVLREDGKFLGTPAEASNE